jgi:hypothetical protein
VRSWLRITLRFRARQFGLGIVFSPERESVYIPAG